MAYGFRSRRKSSARSVNRSTRARSARVKKMGYRKPARRTFVAKRLSRREIKYDDDYFNLNAWDPSSYNSVNLNAGYLNWVLGGVVSTTQNVGALAYFSGVESNMQVLANDKTMTPNCLTNVTSGTSAKTRIGNLIAPRYITIKGVLNAARTNSPKDPETTFKDDPGSDPMTIIQRFLRTSIKMFVVRDKNMNEKGYVTYQDVFEAPDQASGGGLGGNAASNPFLWNRKVDGISRYEIIKEYKFELDQDDPQVSFSYTIPLSGKSIRYNGAVKEQYSGFEQIGAGNFNEVGGVGPKWPAGIAFGKVRTLLMSAESQSMTNGVYILAVAHTAVLETLTASNYVSPTVVFSSRLTFEDN